MRFHVRIIFFSLFVLHLLVWNFLSVVDVCAKASFTEESSGKLKISDISLSVSKFNPQIGERVEIGFSLSNEAMVSLKIFDPDFELVKTLLEKENKKAGPHKVAWDGEAMDGSPVPDEAYFFTIEAKDKNGNTDVYDPITFSGGEMYDVAQADVDKEHNKIHYKLAHSGRVLIRMGLHRGPLVRTLVDWKPRLAGSNTEAWDGKDESGLVNVRDNPHFVAMIAYFTLPENSIITHGNEKVSYRAYKAGLKTARPKKEDRGRTIIAKRPISPHFPQPLTTYQNPKIQATLPDVKKFMDGGQPLIDDRVVIRVDMAGEDKVVIKDRKLELYFFLDNQFLIEDGQAQIPYHFNWNSSNVPEGEHVLTVNLITDNDQIATASKKIVVKRGQRAR